MKNLNILVINTDSDYGYCGMDENRDLIIEGDKRGDTMAGTEDYQFEIEKTVFTFSTEGDAKVALNMFNKVNNAIYQDDISTGGIIAYLS